MQDWKRLPYVLAITGAIAACGGVPVPQSELVDAEASITAAKHARADDISEAAPYLGMAEATVSEARKLIEEDENVLARRALERAKADAELALQLANTYMARAEESAARSEAQRTQQTQQH